MAFHDVDFPLALAFGASGGPTHSVDIVTLASGREVRNSAQSRARRRYNAMTGVKSAEDALVLSRFFEARSGPLHSFRFRDPIDHKATEVPLGVGDGTRTEFALVKFYDTVLRPITKPVAGSVLVKVDGLPVSASVDALTGRVTLVAAPATDAVITASFAFDVPVRFAQSDLTLSLDTHGAISATDIPLIEVFDDA